jgi:hypothetical protein
LVNFGLGEWDWPDFILAGEPVAAGAVLRRLSALGFGEKIARPASAVGCETEDQD